MTRPTRLQKLIFKGWLWDARQKIARIRNYLPQAGNILDIGAGSGSVTVELQRAGYRVTPVDVKNWSLTAEVDPEIYDGRTLPYTNGQFHTALLLTVLHHTPDPDAILREAARVARHVVIIEDVYTGPIHRVLTLAADSLFNLEFRGHPHSNRRDAHWRATFDDMGLTLLATKCFPMLKIFRQQVYWLQK